MIDIHAHILPGVDDGAADMKSALEMAALAAESGVTVLAATPHSTVYGRAQNLWEPALIEKVLELRAAIQKAGIPLQVAPGLEIYGTPEVPQLLRTRKMIGLNESRYPLIEFAFRNYAGQATDILEEIVKLGMRPVVAHPERYEYVQQDPRLLNLWVEMGCLLQVNKGSLLGNFGRTEYYLAHELVARRFAFAAASDAHSPTMRTTWMADTEKLLREEFSEQTAIRLLYTNPLRLLRDEEIREAEPHWFR